MGTVTQIDPSSLTPAEKRRNYAAILLGDTGYYSNRCEVGYDQRTGWLFVPCATCSNKVRTRMDADVDGENPVAHPRTLDVITKATS